MHTEPPSGLSSLSPDDESQPEATRHLRKTSNMKEIDKTVTTKELKRKRKQQKKASIL